MTNMSSFTCLFFRQRQQGIYQLNGCGFLSLKVFRMSVNPLPFILVTPSQAPFYHPPGRFAPEYYLNLDREEKQEYVSTEVKSFSGKSILVNTPVLAIKLFFSGMFIGPFRSTANGANNTCLSLENITSFSLNVLSDLNYFVLLCFFFHT